MGTSSSMGFCAIGLLLVGLVACQSTAGGGGGGGADRKRCRFPAIYNFGDSNSDTGGRSAALAFTELPYGQTFFHEPAGRASDGRLIVDFITEKLGLPYMSAYLDAIGTSFRRGANFATGGSTIRPGGYSPFHLDLQVAQFIQFKSRTVSLFNKITKNRNSTGNEISCKTSSLPRSNEFSNALHMFDIGQNDLSIGFQYSSVEKVRESIPDMIDKFSHSLHQLYEDGARIFWVHNTGPHGCMPNSVFYNRNNPGNFDNVGCVRSQNEVAMEFNRQLKDRVSHLRLQLSNVAITYVDVYSAKYSLIRNAKNLGFGDPMKVCCGSYDGGVHTNCGKTYTPNGTVLYGAICTDPSKRISWDGIHYTDAANSYLAKLIVSGAVSDPRIPVADSCRAATSA